MRKQEESSNISDLPEEILVSIISFLPIEDAIKTSTVARSWRNLWHYVPKLSFNFVNFRHRFDNKFISEVSHLFTDFITNTLNHRQQNMPLQSFRLIHRHSYDCEYKYTESHFDSWLQYLIAAKVAKLDLDFFSFTLFNLDSVHFLNLMKSSVKVLKLSCIRLRFPNDIDEPSCLRMQSIRQVHFDHFSSTDKDITDMIAWCVNLETLSLKSCLDSKNLKIVSQKLRHLKLAFIYADTSVEICAPSLISVDLYQVCPKDISLKRSSSLVEAEVRGLSDISYQTWTCVLTDISGVKRLIIENLWSHDYQIQQGFSETVVFHILKQLELRTRFRNYDVLSMGNLFKQCPQLVIMVLVNEGRGNRNSDKYRKDGLDSVIFQVPRLRLVKMKAFMGSKMELYVLDLLKMHGVVLKKIVVYPKKKADGKSPPSFVY